MLFPDIDPNTIQKKERDLPRVEFLEHISFFVTLLSDVERGLPASDNPLLIQISEVLNKYLEDKHGQMPPQERQLFSVAYGLWCLKNNLPLDAHFPQYGDLINGRGRQELSVEMGGPVATGKSTFAKFLAEQINANAELEKFDPRSNPFLARAYSDPSYMLRAQIKFLLNNIQTGIETSFNPGRRVKDTSVYSDIFVFMEWRRRAGIVTEDEHGAYMALVRLLQPLITRPDLLVLLKPSSGKRLMEGLKERIKDNPEERKMEEDISEEDIEICIQASNEAIGTIQALGVQVYILEIDPVEVYKKESSLKYEAANKIMERLGLL